MKRKTGVVMKVFKNYVSIKTVKGELVNVKIKNYTPNIGDIYSGTIMKKDSKTLNRLIAFIILIALFILARNIYAYFDPKASITINIPPTIQIKVNNWNKVLSVSATRKSGRELISNVKLKKITTKRCLNKDNRNCKRKKI
ncbi:anti-sigma factor domain-containing protein [Clostridium haemolyticum]|uniref:anti-sigma-I factor RsgI family protein n=1 Tax=Clostridium haemolyticum TaxID=84025 RepID=UPI001FA8BD5C|nr:anti-sigma factor domain-containing protein [Clostridium haemolyticum]